MRIKVHDKEFVPYIGSAEINLQISKLAGQINKDYEGNRPLFIAILNGAFMFASDLFKELSILLKILWIRVKHYMSFYPNC